MISTSARLLASTTFHPNPRFETKRLLFSHPRRDILHGNVLRSEQNSLTHRSAVYACRLAICLCGYRHVAYHFLVGTTIFRRFSFELAQNCLHWPFANGGNNGAFVPLDALHQCFNGGCFVVHQSIMGRRVESFSIKRKN